MCLNMFDVSFLLWLLIGKEGHSPIVHDLSWVLIKREWMNKKSQVYSVERRDPAPLISADVTVEAF